MPSTSEMLKFIHKKDPSTLSKRYTPQQLEAAFRKLSGGAGGAASAGTSGGAAANVSMGALGQTATNMAASNLESSGLGEAFNPELINRYSEGDLKADRSRVEEALFANLTRNFDRDKGREEEAIRQRLANEGIPYSADPNSRYQQELGALNERYDTLRSNAMQNAAIIGGQELERNVGINETVRKNQFGEQTGIRGQQLGEIEGLSGINAMAQQLANQRRQLQIQREAAARRGGGGAPVQEPSPFNQTTPPGL